MEEKCVEADEQKNEKSGRVFRDESWNRQSDRGGMGRCVVFWGTCSQVSDRDDRLLQETLQKLTDANTEVDGDADSEGEEEDTGMGAVDVDNPNFTE